MLETTNVLVNKLSMRIMRPMNGMNGLEASSSFPNTGALRGAWDYAKRIGKSLGGSASNDKEHSQRRESKSGHCHHQKTL